MYLLVSASPKPNFRRMRTDELPNILTKKAPDVQVFVTLLDPLQHLGKLWRPAYTELDESEAANAQVRE